MTRLRVESCGPGLTVQDFGRAGLRRFGVASAGAMDRTALALANALCGNPPDAAGIEMVLTGATLTLDGERATVAGAGVALTVDGQRVAEGCSARLQPDARIVVRPLPDRVYGYLAVAGGLATPTEMGSRAQHLRSGIGGAALGPGSVLGIGPGAPGPLRRIASPRQETGPIRVVPGPQDDWFTAAALQRLVSATYRVHPRSDRMGTRLSGEPLPHREGYNIVTDGVVPGAVQVPGDGQPLVLMRDCQTAGGYPKIATVISADLDRLSQVRPGEPVRFVAVTVEQAIAASRDHARRIAGLADMAEKLPDPYDTARLLTANLIGGVTDGFDPADSMDPPAE